MISSKELLEKTGISRATLNNYVQYGVIPRPQTLENSRNPGKAMGYFPDHVLSRIEAIPELKAFGFTLEEIGRFFIDSDWESQLITLRSKHQDVMVLERSFKSKQASHGLADKSSALRLSLDSLSYPAYMLNYNLELTWLNESARFSLFSREIPANSAARNIFSLMAHPQAGHPLSDQRALATMHMRLALPRLSREALAKIVVQAEPDLLPLVHGVQSSVTEDAALAHEHIQLHERAGDSGSRLITAVYFREGILIIQAPGGEQDKELIHFLARRDQVIQDLLRQRLPVMTQLAVLVADLQSSVQICSELPPEEYFQLINQIWAELSPILRRYYGTSGKHVGDGVVHYFFPQPETHYLMNALACAHEIRQRMRILSKEWQIKKNWTRELYLNIGIHEGQEWLGTFQAANHIEFAVLGDTINHAARISDLARNGAIWVTKSLMTKLNPQERDRLEFGIHQPNEDGRDRFIDSSYAQVQSLVDIQQGKYEKLRDIANLAITEVRRVAEPRNPGF